MIAKKVHIYDIIIKRICFQQMTAMFAFDFCVNEFITPLGREEIIIINKYCSDSLNYTFYINSFTTLFNEWSKKAIHKLVKSQFFKVIYVEVTKNQNDTSLNLQHVLIA